LKFEGYLEAMGNLQMIDKVVAEQKDKVQELREGMRNTVIGVYMIKDKIITKKKISGKLTLQLKYVRFYPSFVYFCFILYLVIYGY
jgi:predicted class III extradiol MEMO1 family dioxygenase